MARTPLDKLGDVSPRIAEGFRTLRQGVVEDGPLSTDSVELIVVGALTATRQHAPLVVHLKRLLELGVEHAAIRQAIVAPFGAAATLAATVEGLDIFEELIGEDE